MLPHFSKFRFLVMMQPPILLMMVRHSARFPLLGNPLFYLACEAGLIIIQLKYNFDRSIQNRIIQDHKDKLLIRGIFGRKEVIKEEIVSIEISRGFISRVFDWSQVILNTTTSGRINIYTQRIIDPSTLQFKL